ncbi:Transposon Tf2-9 polyprotein, partial [Pseudoloma neurophilia]
KEFKDFCRKQGIRLTNTSPYNPTANGIVERMNKAIAHIVRINKTETIQAICRTAEIYHNHTVHNSLKTMPYALAFNEILIDPRKPKVDLLDQAMQSQRENQMKNQQKMNQTRTDHLFQKGDRVYVCSPHNTKLSQRFDGPYTVMEVSHSKNRLKLKSDTGEFYTNIKNIRLEGGSMSRTAASPDTLISTISADDFSVIQKTE